MLIVECNLSFQNYHSISETECSGHIFQEGLYEKSEKLHINSLMPTLIIALGTTNNLMRKNQHHSYQGNSSLVDFVLTESFEIGEHVRSAQQVPTDFLKEAQNAFSKRFLKKPGSHVLGKRLLTQISDFQKRRKKEEQTQICSSQTGRK